MDVLAQLARNTGYSVRVNHKVSRSTTAAASNKQGDVELVNFGLVGSNNLVIDVSICCDHIGNSKVNNGHLNGKMHTNDYQVQRITLLLVRRLHLQLCQWLDKFIPSFFVSCGSWLTNTRAITMRSLVQKRRLTARLSCGVEHARLVLTRTLLARQSLMPPTPLRAQYSSAVASSTWPAHFIG